MIETSWQQSEQLHSEVKKDMEKNKQDPEYQDAFKELEKQRQKLRIDEVLQARFP